MRALLIVALLALSLSQADAQFWKYPQQFFDSFNWLRQGKTAPESLALTTQQTLPATKITTELPTTKKEMQTTMHAEKKITEKSQIENQVREAQLRESQLRDSQQRDSRPRETPTREEKRETHPASKFTSTKLPQKTHTKSTQKTNPKFASAKPTTKQPGTTFPTTTTFEQTKNSETTFAKSSGSTKRTKPRNTTPLATVTKSPSTRKTNPTWTTITITTQPPTKPLRTTNATVVTEATTFLDTTTQDLAGTTEEPRDNQRVPDFYLNKQDKPEVKIASNISQNLLPLPAGASAALVKPTKYHYYPHNQHIYLLPECAIQQVCNAVYVRLNWTQPLCACPSRYRDPCSASLNSDDLHTTELMTDRKSKRALTLVKTCEPTADMRICRAPRDWSLLALQNIRTGKSHYLVICRCPDNSVLEGPMSHDQPTYASVPGIRVYGMMCVQSGNIKRRGRPLRLSRSLENPPFPWHKVKELSEHALWD